MLLIQKQFWEINLSGDFPHARIHSHTEFIHVLLRAISSSGGTDFNCHPRCLNWGNDLKLLTTVLHVPYYCDKSDKITVRPIIIISQIEFQIDY